MNMRSIIYLCLILPLATLVVQAQDRGAVIIDQRNVVDTLPPEREYPELPVVLQQRLEAIRHSKQTLVDALKKVLEENVDATAEQRKAAADAWRQANTDRLTNQRHEATLARLEVKAWLEANRPERPLPQEIESAASITTVQREEQLAAMKQRQTDIQAENKQIAAAIQEAVTEDERREIIAQHRTQRLEQIQDQQRLQDLRSDKLDRQSSLTNIQNTLRRNAESIRIQNRLPMPSSLEQPTSPPRASANFREITRPRPIPPYCRLRLPSTWEKGLKSLFRSSFLIPIPVSWISMRKE